MPGGNCQQFEQLGRLSPGDKVRDPARTNLDPERAEEANSQVLGAADFQACHPGGPPSSKPTLVAAG